MKISIHIHSEYSSDSKQTIRSIIEQCKMLGYDAIAITDHNTVAGSLAAAKMQPENMQVISGAEFSTDKGHIIALFINEAIEKSCRINRTERGNEYDFNDLVLKVREQNGLLFLAHPLQSGATQDHSFIARLDGYELINGRINSSHKNKRANQLSTVLKANYPDKILIGGSDAHTKSEIESVYMTSGCTDLKEALRSVDSICFRKSSMMKIRYNNMIIHKKRPLKYHIKQSAAMLVGLFYDLGTKIKGDSYEVIRVRKEG